MILTVKELSWTIDTPLKQQKTRIGAIAANIKRIAQLIHCMELAGGVFSSIRTIARYLFIMRIIRKYAYLCFMKARLNLTIDEGLLVTVKKLAEKNNTSVSELVTDFFKKLAKPPRQKNIIDLVEKLEKPAIPSDADLKDLYYKEQGKKYGF